MSHELDPLLRPQSIAVVGATQRDHAVGNRTIKNLINGSYAGTLFAVNPGYDDVMGVACFPTLADLPERVEHVIFAVGDNHIEQALDDAIAHGAKAVTIMSSLVLANDGDPPLKDRIHKKVCDANLLVCGANCMGFYNVTDRVLAGGFDTRQHEPPGNITLISHSGAGMAGIVDCDERLRFNLVVTTGQELTLCMEDYLHFALDLPETCVVGLFMETSRKPDALLAAFAKANKKRIPIVAIKVGKADLSKKLTYSHSGAMAGSDKAFNAAFDRYGVQRVTDMDQLATALIMFAQPHKVASGGLATIHDSGGERQLTIDLAERIDLPLASLAPETVTRLRGALDPGLEPVNPLDAWGAGGEQSDDIMRECFAALMSDPDTALGAVVHDRAPYSQIYPEYLDFLRVGHAASGKPVFLVAARQGTGSDNLVVESTASGFPVLDGLRSFLRGAKCLLNWRDHLGTKPDSIPVVDPITRQSWSQALDSDRPIGEAQSCALLKQCGIPAVQPIIAHDEKSAIDAADTIGYPVVLKTANPEITHKTDYKAVHLNLDSDKDVASAYREVATNLGPDVLLAKQVDAGYELIMGMNNDEHFGPVVMIGAGGIAVETDIDAQFALAPFGPATARRMIDRLRMRPALDGVRGGPGVDMDALCDIAARLSAISSEFKDKISSIDINPIIAAQNECIAVDALIVPGRGQADLADKRKAG